MGLNAVYIEVVSGGRIHSGGKKTPLALLQCYWEGGTEPVHLSPEDRVPREEEADKGDCAKNRVSALTPVHAAQHCLSPQHCCCQWGR